MPSTHRDVFPSNARQQARIGSCFKRLLGNKNASGHVFSDYPKNVAVGCQNALPSTVVGSFRDPSGTICYPQGHFGHFFVHYSMGHDSTRHWTRNAFDSPKIGSFRYPSAHFVSHRAISLPTGVFWSFFRALPRACVCTWHRSQSAQHARVGHARALPRQPAWLPLAWQGGRPPPLIYASLAFPHVAGRNIFSSEERTSHFFEKLSFSQQSANWNLFKTFCSTFTKKFRFFFQRDYLLLINFEKQP